MKLIISLLLTLTSYSAFASYEVNKCKITATSKVSNITLEREVYLSSDSANLFNKIELSPLKTDLNIHIDHQGKLHGSVNGQYMFILEGTLDNGSFESAYAKGSIVCGEVETVAAIYNFGGAWQPLTAENTFVLSTSNYPKACYIGNANYVANFLRTNLEKAEVAIGEKDSVNVTVDVQVCTSGARYYEEPCEAYRTERRTYALKDCYEEDVRPLPAN